MYGRREGVFIPRRAFAGIGGVISAAAGERGGERGAGCGKNGAVGGTGEEYGCFYSGGVSAEMLSADKSGVLDGDVFILL